MEVSQVSPCLPTLLGSRVTDFHPHLSGEVKKKKIEQTLKIIEAK